MLSAALVSSFNSSSVKVTVLKSSSSLKSSYNKTVPKSTVVPDSSTGKFCVSYPFKEISRT